MLGSLLCAVGFAVTLYLTLDESDVAKQSGVLVFLDPIVVLTASCMCIAGASIAFVSGFLLPSTGFERAATVVIGAAFLFLVCATPVLGFRAVLVSYCLIPCFSAGVRACYELAVRQMRRRH